MTACEELMHGKPCPYEPKYLNVAWHAPKFICGYHGRAYLRSALIKLMEETPDDATQHRRRVHK